MRMLSTPRTMRALLVCHRVWEGLIKSIHSSTLPCFKQISGNMASAVRDGSTQRITPLLTAMPSRALVDQPIEMRIQHLPLDKPFTVRSRLLGEDGELWEAFSHYRSDQKGTVILSRDQSLGGSYSGLEPMGLFWSLQPRGQRGLRLRKKNTDTPFTVEISVINGHVGSSDSPEGCHVGQELQEGAVLAVVNVERWYMAPGVCRVEVREQGVVGTLFLPAGPGPFPAVLDICGLGGGLNEYRSALLASHGFVSLALAYSGHKELPEPLHTVNVGDRYFKTAMGLLDSHPQVCTGRVGVLGQCFGGYLALRIAMEMPNVNPRCVVGISASAGLKINVTKERMNDFMKERREEVVRLGQQLLSLMEHNFWATNRLATLLNREMNTGLREISVDKQKTIKENCDMLIDTIGSIQAQVAQIDSRLKENLEPELYQKLYSLTVPLSDRIHIASRVLSGAFGVLGSGVTVAELIHKGAVLGRIVASLGRVGTCAVATVVLGVLGLGVDMVASAILGAIERENLERVIQEYSEALEEFRPASEQYLENIGNVIARVQFKRGH